MTGRAAHPEPRPRRASPGASERRPGALTTPAGGADAGATLAELVAVVASSSVVLLAAAALVLPLVTGARTVQERGLASSDVAASARVHRDLDRQLRSATRVQYVDPQRLRLCTYASTDASTRTWLQWTSPPASTILTAAPVGGDSTQGRTYTASTAVFDPPASSPVDGVYAPGQPVTATLESWSGEARASRVVTTLPRATTEESCP